MDTESTYALQGAPCAKKEHDGPEIFGAVRRGALRLKRAPLWLLVSLVAFVLSSQAQAGGGGNASDASLTIVVFSILCIGVAYVAANYVVDGLQRRFLILSGFEYFLLGVLLGPAVPQLEVLTDLRGLLPVIALASGWVGLLRGMELNLRRLDESPPGSTRMALVHSVLVASMVALGAYVFFQSGLIGDVNDTIAALASGVLACSAITGSIAPSRLLETRYSVEGNTLPLLRRSIRLGDLIAIAGFGILVCVFHKDPKHAPLLLHPTEWAVLSVGLGISLGLLFRPFLGGDESPNGRFLALVGIITFAGGAAYVLRLSNLFVSLVLGLTLVNTAKSGPIIRATLENTERPMALVLLVLAGAMWEPPPWLMTSLVFLAFVAVRWIFAGIAGLVAASGMKLRWDMFRGRFSHGELTIAIAVGFQLFYQGDAVNLAYSVLIASYFFHDLIAPRALRALLVDMGEIKRENNSSGPPGPGTSLPTAQANMAQGITAQNTAAHTMDPPSAAPSGVPVSESNLHKRANPITSSQPASHPSPQRA